MDLSEFMNIILGGGLVGTVATIGSLRATVRKAKAEAMKAEAGAEAMRIDNAEHATRILMENIVKPLKDEFCETRKNWPAIRARWPVLEKLLIQPGTVLIVTIALCLTGCASHRKSMNREVRTETASADSASGSRRAGTGDGGDTGRVR